jgi:hypothetical protein
MEPVMNAMRCSLMTVRIRAGQGDHTRLRLMFRAETGVEYYDRENTDKDAPAG